jgi:hypothetical protein
MVLYFFNALDGLSDYNQPGSVAGGGMRFCMMAVASCANPDAICRILRWAATSSGAGAWPLSPLLCGAGL